MVIRLNGDHTQILITTPYDNSPFGVSKDYLPFILEIAEIRLNLFLMLVYDYKNGDNCECIHALWQVSSIKKFNEIWNDTW